MRRDFSKSILAIALTFTVGLMACGDDAPTSDAAGADTVTDSDTGTAADTGTEGDTSTPPEDVPVSVSVCDQYCAAVDANCTADNVLDFGDKTCAEACATWPEGADGDTGNNTTHCRLYHAGVAATDPVVHCPHASADGGGVCVD